MIIVLLTIRLLFSLHWACSELLVSWWVCTVCVSLCFGLILNYHLTNHSTLPLSFFLATIREFLDDLPQTEESREKVVNGWNGKA